MEKNFNKQRLYRVQEKENVLSISKKFNVTPNKIIVDNNLKAEVEEGDVLILDENLSLYTVKLNESIEDIAKKFNTDPEKIKQDNHIEYVYYGLKIII